MLSPRDLRSFANWEKAVEASAPRRRKKKNALAPCSLEALSSQLQFGPEQSTRTVDFQG